MSAAVLTDAAPRASALAFAADAARVQAAHARASLASRGRLRLDLRRARIDTRRGAARPRRAGHREPRRRDCEKAHAPRRFPRLHGRALWRTDQVPACHPGGRHRPRRWRPDEDPDRNRRLRKSSSSRATESSPLRLGGMNDTTVIRVLGAMVVVFSAATALGCSSEGGSTGTGSTCGTSSGSTQPPSEGTSSGGGSSSGGPSGPPEGADGIQPMAAATPCSNTSSSSGSSSGGSSSGGSSSGGSSGSSSGGSSSGGSSSGGSSSGGSSSGGSKCSPTGGGCSFSIECCSNSCNQSKGVCL